MKSLKILSWVGILAMIFLSSCRKDIENNNTSTSVDLPIVLVESTIYGQVIDEAGLPVEGAVVKINSENQNTDENGVFRFENREFNADGTLVNVQKLGFYTGIKMVNPNVGSESYVRIQLLRKEQVGNFETSAGGTVQAADGSAIVFSPNSIRTEAGNDYSGTVNVFLKWIDPSDESIMEQMPGDLRAIDVDDQRVQLATYGMIAVELQSPDGNELNIKDGYTADIIMPIPPSYQGNVPNTIPLWSFDESTGYWIEEGEAVVDGDTYRGPVSHFSFWNCDAPFPVVPLCGSVASPSGVPISNVRVKIFVNDDIGVRYGWVDSEGFFSGDVPKDMEMTFYVEDLCGVDIHEMNIGPFSEKADLGIINVDVDEPVSISGNLLNCDGNPVTNGYVYVSYVNGSEMKWVDENGAFEMSTYLCENQDLTITAYDLDALTQSEDVEISATPGNSVDLGDISVCEDIQEYVHVTVPSLSYDKYIFTGYTGMVDPIENRIALYKSEQDSVGFAFTFVDAVGQTGNVPVDVWYSDFLTLNGGTGIFLFCSSTCEANIEINEGSGGRFKASFEGLLMNEFDNMEQETTIEIDVILEE